MTAANADSAADPFLVEHRLRRPGLDEPRVSDAACARVLLLRNDLQAWGAEQQLTPTDEPLRFPSAMTFRAPDRNTQVCLL